jgi:hypothetical protein
MITDLAESGAGDQTIMDIAGHVSKNMLKHYSHIRMEAKREALESIVSDHRRKSPSQRVLEFEGRVAFPLVSTKLRRKFSNRVIAHN